MAPTLREVLAGGGTGAAHAVAYDFVHNCSSPPDCRRVVDGPLRVHLAAMTPRLGRQNQTLLRACARWHALVHTEHATMWGANASARSTAFLRACNDRAAPGLRDDFAAGLSRDDARAYFSEVWLPVPGRCASLTRLGPSYTNTRAGDGGKTVCDASALLAPSRCCLVVSVGLKDDTRFESAVHRLAPHCEVHGYDGTLRPKMRAMLPSFLRLFAANFLPTTWRAKEASGAALYTHRAVSIFKMDCEGCEFSALVPWLEHVCTEQVMVEIHTTAAQSPQQRVLRVHRLLTDVDRLGFDVFFLEPNPVYPELCREVSLVRREPCAAAGGGATQAGHAHVHGRHAVSGAGGGRERNAWA